MNAAFTPLKPAAMKKSPYLQHDGVLLQLRPYDDKPYVETALTSLCSAALGYPQPVSHKPWPGSDQKA